MRKIFKSFVAVCLVFSLMSGFTQAFAANVKGDMNSDGKIKLSDVHEILRIASSMELPSEAELSKADMDSDGSVTIEDVRKALSKAVDVNPAWTLNKITQLTPSKKHKSSTKMKFCKVTEYCAETLPSNNLNNRSNPLYSPLPKGTYDYVKSGPYKDGDSGEDFYILGSGRKVYGNEIKIFTGYKMPYNNARLRNPVIYNTDSTKFYIALDWRVPFNVTIKPQSYTSGYDGREFNVKNDKFTGKYMDITFFYTKTAEGALSFPESDTIKSCKWIINKDNKTATLRVYFREQGDFYGYSVKYNKNNLLVVSVKEPVDKLKGRTIMIDPGHGGDDPGAVAAGVYECNITYKIALKLKSYLENRGAKVILTRDNGDVVPDIVARRFTAMKKEPDLYVSLHLDAAASSSAHGSTVFYYKNYSAPLAKAIQKNLPKIVKDDLGYQLSDRGVHFYPFKVTRIETCPSVLVECGFITNTSYVYTPPANAKLKATSDFQLLNSASGQKSVARGVYKGILEYFGI